MRKKQVLAFVSVVVLMIAEGLGIQSPSCD